MMPRPTVYVTILFAAVLCVEAVPSSPAVEWTYTTFGAVYSSPTVVGGILYVGSNDYNVYALNTAGWNAGGEIWSFPTGNQVQSSPTVVNGTLYVGSYDNNVYALRLQATQSPQMKKQI